MIINDKTVLNGLLYLAAKYTYSQIIEIYHMLRTHLKIAFDTVEKKSKIS